MSYSLHFYKKKTSGLTEETFADYLSKRVPFMKTENPKQWWYENPETAVYFVIDQEEPYTEEDEIQMFDRFDDFTSLRFTFTINFIRPQFFGLEVFPVLEKIIDDNDLWILNPNGQESADVPQQFAPGHLRDQWIEDNDRMSLKLFSEVGVDYFPLEKSNVLWRFLFHRVSIQNSMTDDVFVAGYFTIKSHADGNIYTLCVWPEHIPVVLPPVDYVLIGKKVKTLFRTKTEDGLVPYETIIAKFGKHFEPLEHAIPGLKILRPGQSDQISKEFNKLVLQRVNEFGVGVAFDKFVNVRP